jgi:hypothetical protein
MNKGHRIYTSEGWTTVSDQAMLDKWMDKVNTILTNTTGQGIGYYPSIPYNDLYKAGISPLWASCIVLDIAWGIYGVNPRTLRQELGVGA